MLGCVSICCVVLYCGAVVCGDCDGDCGGECGGDGGGGELCIHFIIFSVCISC